MDRYGWTKSVWEGSRRIDKEKGTLTHAMGSARGGEETG